MDGKNLKRGFTLIELLVVIAIIGVLSSIVLASLNTARSKGSDAAIKAGLANIRAQAELYYDSNSDYGDTVASGTCPSSGTTMFGEDVTIKNMIASVATSSGGTGLTNTTCAAGAASGSATSWAVAAKLKSDATKFWCVDSAGNSKQVAGNALGGGTSAAVCPAS